MRKKRLRNKFGVTEVIRIHTRETLIVTHRMQISGIDHGKNFKVLQLVARGSLGANYLQIICRSLKHQKFQAAEVRGKGMKGKIHRTRGRQAEEKNTPVSREPVSMTCVHDTQVYDEWHCTTFFKRNLSFLFTGCSFMVLLRRKAFRGKKQGRGARNI